MRLQIIFDALDKVSGPLKRIFAGAGGTSKKIKELRTQLDGLRRSQTQIASARGMEQRLDSTRQKLQAQRAETERLRREMAQAGTATDAMRRKFEQAEREEEKLTRAHDRQQKELQELREKLRAAGHDVSDLERAERELKDATDKANKELKEQADRLEKLEAARERGQQLRETGKRMMGYGAAMLAPLVAAGIVTANFETQLTDIGQKAEMTREQVAELGRTFDRMGPRLAQLPSALAGGVDVLMGMGASADQALGSIEAIARASTAYRAEIADVSNAVWSSLDNLKLPIGDVGRALDMMAVAGNRGSFELRDMAQYFPALTAASSALGQRGAPAVADLAAALQIARKGAGDSSTAANNLLNLLNKITSQDAIRNFRKMGIDLQAALAEGMRQGKSPIEIITEQTRRATGGDLSKLSQLFADAQVQAALRPLVQNLDLYREIRSEALRAQGTVEAAFQERLGDAATQWQQLKAHAEAFGHAVGRVVLPIAKELMGWLASIAQGISNWAAENPILFETLVKIVAILGGLLIILGAIAFAVGTVLVPIAIMRFALIGALPVLKRVGSVLKWLGRAVLFLATTFLRAGLMMLANPVVLAIVAVIAAIAALAYAIYTYWDEIKEVFAAVGRWLHARWEDIKNIFGAAVGWIGRKLGELLDGIKAVFDSILQWLGIQPEKFYRAARAIFDAIARGLSGSLSIGGGTTSALRAMAERRTSWISNLVTPADRGGANNQNKSGGQSKGAGDRGRPAPASVSATFNISGAGDPRAVADEVLRALADMQASAAGGSYNDD